MTSSPDPLNPESTDAERPNEDVRLPVEVEFYIENDGTVVFADLAADLLPIAQELNPDQPLVCDVIQAPDLSEVEEEQ